MMSYLSLYLPTATGDFSGAASALFALDCCNIILDPKGCTADYLTVEDPRLPLFYTRTESARLDDVDITLGDITRLTQIAQTLIKQHHPTFLALVGSTVSAIIGLDVELYAQELECEVGIPVVAIDCTGFTSYAQGIHLASKALIERFGSSTKREENAVNILGATPCDFKSEHDSLCFEREVQNLGYRVIGNFCMGLTIEQICAAPNASVNLAVSSSGIATAKWMQEAYGIPYVACTPICKDDKTLARLLAATVADGQSRSVFTCCDANGGADGCDEARRILLVGDELICASLLNWLREAGDSRPATIATFFRTESGLMPGVHLMKGDIELLEAIERLDIDTIIGDPLLRKIPHLGQRKFLPFPHPALSALLYRGEMPTFADDVKQFEQYLRS